MEKINPTAKYEKLTFLRYKGKNIRVTYIVVIYKFRMWLIKHKLF